MTDVDVHWIVRQMIGSDAKDFSTPGDQGFGGEALRAEDICLPRITGGYAVDHVSLDRSRRRDRRRLRAHGRGTQRVPRMRDGPPPAGVRPHLHRGQARPRARRRRTHRARPRAHPRGPPARRARADPVGRREPDSGEPAQADARASTSRRAPRPRRSSAKSGTCRSRSPTPRCRCRRCPAATSRRS